MATLVITGDGRQFTDYFDILKWSNLNRDDTYRLYLQNNSQNIINNMNYQNRYINQQIRTACIHKYPLNSNLNQLIQERMVYNSGCGKLYSGLCQCPVYPEYKLNP